MRVSALWRCAWLAGALTGSLAGAESSYAQGDYPNKPIRLISPYVAGGSVDLVGRVLAKQLSLQMKQPVILIDQGGAGGIIAAAQVAHAPPDGYTVFIGATGPLAIAPAIYRDPHFSTLKDFAPVSLFGKTSYVVLINPKLPVHSIGDLIAYARLHPGQLNFASSGTGGPDHLAGELFKTMAHVDIAHVPYQGSGPALTDVVAGHVQLTITGPVASLALVQSGQLRALAVTGSQRSSVLPDLPTMRQAGVPGYEITSWYGLVVPAGTPRPIIDRLNAELKTALRTQALKSFMLQSGTEPVTDTPEQFSAFLGSELQKWRKLAELAHVANTR
jgi:tripartite-type tricarboxylate transporter receptor subunit TctC